MLLTIFVQNSRKKNHFEESNKIQNYSYIEMQNNTNMQNGN